LLWFLTDQLGG